MHTVIITATKKSTPAVPIPVMRIRAAAQEAAVEP